VLDGRQMNDVAELSKVTVECGNMVVLLQIAGMRIVKMPTSEPILVE